MNWDTALKARLLGKGEGLKLLQQFLRANLPEFRATNDLAAWKRERERLQRDALANVYLKGFPASVVRSKPRIVWGEILRPDRGYVIRKLRYEIYPDYWIPAALYEPANRRGGAKLPVMLNPNGHHTGGKAATYKQARCANLARRGVIALNMEFIGMSELGADRGGNNIAHVDWTGIAGVGLFYLALQKGLDVLLDRPSADRTRVGVTGLSGGGWQTIVFASLDPRVTLSVPVAGYTSLRARVGCLRDIGDLEQTPCDMASVLDYTHMTAMLAPNPTLLIYNAKDDCCFRTNRVRKIVFDPIRPTYAALGAAEKFEIYSNHDPGTHNYDADSRAALYRFLNKHWKLNGPERDTHREDEILTEEQLVAGLPVNQKTMLTIAGERARAAVAKLKTPRTSAERQALRRKLIETIRLPQYDAPKRAAYRAGVSNSVLSVGPWKIPMSARVQNARGAESVLYATDVGRATIGGMQRPSERNQFVIDILGTGENECDERHRMMIDSTGRRYLGERVAQMLAVAKHLVASTGKRIHLVGISVPSALAALIAAGLEPKLFASVTAEMSFRNLANVVLAAEKYADMQGAFCFGLLEVADVPQLIGLLEGVEFRQPGRVVKSVAS